MNEKSAEQSGTTIREFFTKLVKADKSAEEMLDANLKRVNARIDENGKLMDKKQEGGMSITASTIQKLALEDVGKAVDLMSNLSINGMLDMETMIKVFNGRYGLVVNNMLKTIGGSHEEYNRLMKETTDLTADASIQMENINVKLDRFKNALFAVGAGSDQVGLLNKSFGRTLDNLTGLLNGMHKVLSIPAVSWFNTFALSAIVAYKGISLLNLGLGKLFWSLNSIIFMGGISTVLTPWIAVPAILAGVAIAMGSMRKNAKESELAFNANANALKSFNLKLERAKIASDALSKSLKESQGINHVDFLKGLTIESGLQSQQMLDLIKNWEDYYDLQNQKPQTYTISPQDTIDLNKAKDNFNKARRMWVEYYGEEKEVSEEQYSKLSGVQKGYYDKYIKSLTEKRKIEDKILQEENSVKSNNLKLEEDRLEASQKAYVANNEFLIELSKNRIASSQAKDVGSLVKEISALGGTPKKYMDNLVNSAKDLGITLTVAKLKNSEFIENLANGTTLMARIKELQDKLIVSTANYGKVLAQASLLAVPTKERQVMLLELSSNLEIIEAIKQEAQALGKDTKKVSKSMIDFLSISREYEKLLAKRFTHNQDELTQLKLKKEELMDIYKLEFETKKLELKNAGYTGNVDTKNLLERRKALEGIVNKYANQEVLGATKESVEKNRKELELINAVLILIKTNSNDISDNANEFADKLKEQKKYLDSMTLSIAEVTKGNIELLDIELQRKLVGKGILDSHKLEMDLISAKYKAEKGILEIKKQQLIDSLKGTKITKEELVKESKDITISSFAGKNIKKNPKIVDEQVKLLQRQLGLKEDGRFGDDTEKALSKALGTRSVSTINKTDWDKIMGTTTETKVSTSTKKSEVNLFDTFDKASIEKAMEEYKQYQSDLLDGEKTLTTEQKNRFEAMGQLLTLYAQEEVLIAQHRWESMTKESNLVKEIYSKDIEALNTSKEYNSLLDFRESLFRSESDVKKLAIGMDKKMYHEQGLALGRMMDGYQEQINLAEDLGDIEKAMFLETEKNNLLELEQEKRKVEWIKIQNSELQRQYDIQKSLVTTGFDMLESLSKGEGIKLDLSKAREGAISALTGKLGMGKEMNRKDYANIGAVGISFLDNFMKTSMAGKQAELDYESKILDLRLQGAKTEEEKSAIQKEQLELQKKMIDYQMQQSTGFLGASGGAGGFLGGAFSGAMAGAASGSWEVALAGGIIGGVSGLISGNKEKKEAERQKKLLEMQAQMNEYLANVAKFSQTSNQALQSMASNATKIGLVGAENKFRQEMLTNPSKFNVGGAGKKSGTESYTEEDWYVKYRGMFDMKVWRYGDVTKYRDILKTANYELKDFNVTSLEQIDSLHEIQNVRNSITEELEKQKKLQSVGEIGEQLQAKANVQALEEMLKNYNNTFATIEKMARHTYKQAFGATLLEQFEADGTTIKDYVADWTEVLASTYSGIISSIYSDSKISGKAITKRFFDGFIDTFVRNSTGMNAMANAITDQFVVIGEAIANRGLESLNDIANESMPNLIASVEEYKKQQEIANKTADSFINMWLTQGGKLSDVYDSLSANAKTTFDSMKSALNANTYSDLLSGLGSSIGNTFIDALSTSLIDNKLKDTFTSLYGDLSKSLENLTAKASMDLWSGISSASVALSNQQNYLKSIASIFDLGNQNVSYDQENIVFQTGSTKDVIYNYNIQPTIYSNFVFADNQSQLDEFARNIANPLVDILKNERN
jgi:hypothetical protein